MQVDVDIARTDARSSQELKRRRRDLPGDFRRLRVGEHDLGRRRRVLEIVDRLTQVPCRLRGAALELCDTKLVKHAGPLLLGRRLCQRTAKIPGRRWCGSL